MSFMVFNVMNVIDVNPCLAPYSCFYEMGAKYGKNWLEKQFFLMTAYIPVQIVIGIWENYY